jgi:hypothetical protein
MNQPGALTWLHLSDAHIGDPRNAPDAEHVLDMLARDLTAMQRDRDLRPDLVFFTGDAAFGEMPSSPLEQQYREVERFFEGVCAAFDPPIPRDRVFIVPGNHDVNRNEASEDQRAWLELIMDNGSPAEEKIDALIRRGDVQWKRYMERLRAYSAFLEKAGFSHLLQDPLRLTYAQKVDVAGVCVGILGLNTAWSCASDNAKGKVWLGGWQLTSLQSQLRGCGLKIALSHHPFNWLTEREDPRIGRDVSRMFDFHLHGHEHEDWILEDGNHTRIAAGACYDRSSKHNGYNFTVMDVRSGVTHVHLRAYDRQGQGWVPRCIHGRTSDHGVWRLNHKYDIASTPARRVFASPRPSQEVIGKKPLAAHDYFSPAREIEDADKFVGRKKELEKAVCALRSDGASVAIFGQAGLGKTSLALQVAHVASGDHREQLARLNVAHLVPPGGFAHPVTYYCCQNKDRSLAHVLTAILRDSHPPFSTRAILRSGEVSRELEREENRDLARQLELIRTSAAQPSCDAPPIAADVVSVFAGIASLISAVYGGRSLVVVLDEFNVVEDKTGMSGLLKELHFVTFVLVGTAVDIRLLVRDHGSVSRQLEEGQVRVREMGESELKEIIQREEARSRGGFHFSPAAVLEIISAASGMPYFVHLLGRYALHQALATRSSIVTDDPLLVELKHVQQALSDSADHMADLEQKYGELTRASWQREFVLKLLAARAESEVAISGIADIARSQGVPAVGTQIDYFVRHGVLERTHSDIVRFHDPRLRVFARLRAPLHEANQRRLGYVEDLERRSEPQAARDSDVAPTGQYTAVHRRKRRATEPG